MGPPAGAGGQPRIGKTAQMTTRSTLPAPYATHQQCIGVWERFVPASGVTVEKDGTTFELSVQDGFCVFFVRVDETGDHFALSQDEAREAGLLCANPLVKEG